MTNRNRFKELVDAMRASSPTHVKSSADQNYNYWTMQHPSALEMFDEIAKASKGKQIVMFLDYDGTLSPIVDDPDRAYISPAVYKSLVEVTKDTPGARVENNKFCVSVHFRCVDEKKWIELAKQVEYVIRDYPNLRLTQGRKKWIELAKQVEYVIRDYPNLRLTQGRKVFEIRPTIKWDKGKALEFLLESLGYANCTDVFPVYIGDDKTDEDAFKVLKERGQGFGILVSKNPKDTNALYSLREPSEVMAFLRRLVDSKRLSLRRQFRLIRRLEEIKVSLTS